jgi:uncharacterized protein with GYD domain
MPKYLIQASYTSEGVKGVLAKGGTARRSAAEAAAKSVGGKVEQFYFAFGENDVVAIIDLPDHASAAALSLAVTSSGDIRSKATVLITPEEIDAASKKSPDFRPPGA